MGGRTGERQRALQVLQVTTTGFGGYVYTEASFSNGTPSATLTSPSIDLGALTTQARSGTTCGLKAMERKAH